MKIEVKEVRTTRNDEDMSFEDDGLDVLDVIETVIGTHRARQRFERGESRFGIKPISITITF